MTAPVAPLASTVLILVAPEVFRDPIVIAESPVSVRDFADVATRSIELAERELIEMFSMPASEISAAPVTAAIVTAIESEDPVTPLLPIVILLVVSDTVRFAPAGKLFTVVAAVEPRTFRSVTLSAFRRSRVAVPEAVRLIFSIPLRERGDAEAFS